jgi:hypothetical protein
MAFVAMEFAEELFAKRPNDGPVPVVRISGSNAKIERITPVIDRQMEFEAIEPSRRAFARGCHVLKNPVSLDTFVFAYGYFGGIDKGDTGALAKTNQLQKQGKRDHDFPFKLNKAIVRRRIVELTP